MQRNTWTSTSSFAASHLGSGTAASFSGGIHRQLSRLSSLRRLSFELSTSRRGDRNDGNSADALSPSDPSSFASGRPAGGGGGGGSGGGDDDGDNDDDDDSLLCWSSSDGRRDSAGPSTASTASDIPLRMLSSHLCSGTVNGRGSFMSESLRNRQQRFANCDSLERVLQDPIRIRKLFVFLKEKACSELLEFWSLVELYQNFYWKPLKLLGFYDEIVGDGNDNDDGPAAAASDSDSDSDAGNHNSTRRSGGAGRNQLADLLSCFSIGVEEKLREEILHRYVRRDAPIQVCMPSAMRELIVARSREAHLLPQHQRLAIFRDAQRFCYGELQLNLMATFFQREAEIVMPTVEEGEEEGASVGVGVGVGVGVRIGRAEAAAKQAERDTATAAGGRYARRGDQDRSEPRGRRHWRGLGSRGEVQDWHSPGLASMNSSLFAAQVFGEATGSGGGGGGGGGEAAVAAGGKTSTLSTGSRRRQSDWSAGW
jgi:hypothetical protein